MLAANFFDSLKDSLFEVDKSIVLTDFLLVVSCANHTNKAFIVFILKIDSNSGFKHNHNNSPSAAPLSVETYCSSFGQSFDLASLYSYLCRNKEKHEPLAPLTVFEIRASTLIMILLYPLFGAGQHQGDDRKENSESAEQICWLAIALLLLLFACYSLILQRFGIYNAELFRSIRTAIPIG